MGLFPSEHETIDGVGRALREGRTTCVEVLERCLDRIEEWEPRVRAWVVVDRDGALAQARALDEELAAGNVRGPLHGIPIGVKDIIDVAGLPTAAGFRPWKDRIAEADAPLVARLREAGAVILGKTVTTQFAWIDPPPTRNPWNLERTPGGSSSGSAAAVALGMCLGALGSQTGGSITRPASFCGVCGFKPTFGALPTEGIVPFAPSLDHPGPIAPTVRDLGLMYEALQTKTDRCWEVPVLTEHTLPGRMGRLRGFFEDRADPAMRRALDDAVSALIGTGARVDEAPMPEEFDEVHHRHRVIMASEAAAGHERRLAEHRDDYAPRIAELIAEGMAISAAEYVRCREHLERDRWSLGTIQYRDQDYEKVLTLITPATIGPAPDISTTGDPTFNSPWSYAGRPTISLPIGLSPDGLPLAIQLVGFRTEVRLFRAALWCEAVIRRALRARSD
jgi:Asp-tRNA(Asn)/Glu-tRNA(Gln) amidotransferase A subunit family amidase